MLVCTFCLHKCQNFPPSNNLYARVLLKNNRKPLILYAFLSPEYILELKFAVFGQIHIMHRFLLWSFRADISHAEFLSAKRGPYIR